MAMRGKSGKGGSAAKPLTAVANSIQPGGLHRSLGIPIGQKIPPGQIAAAASKPGKVGKQARLAQTFAKFRPKGKSGKSKSSSPPKGKM